MEPLTRTVLTDLARLKRTGVIPERCPSCGAGHHDHHTPSCANHMPMQSLRGHAQDPDAYDRALATIRGDTHTLRVLTTQRPAGAIPLPTAPTCLGTHTCDCPTCNRERIRLVKQGGQGNGNANPFHARPARDRRRAA